MERMNSAGSSIKRRSLSVSSSHASHTTHNVDDAAECDSVSEAGDIGDRALPSIRLSDAENESLVLSLSLTHDPLNSSLKQVLGSQDSKQVSCLPFFHHFFFVFFFSVL